MIMTSGYNVEGYNITSYLGHETAQVVLGTGFFSATGAAFADLFGATSNSYEEKLDSAEKLAKDRLIKQAKAMGGNAIIGVDVDYTVFVNDVMGVIVSGTVVIIEKIKSKASVYCNVPVFSFNGNLPFNISDIKLIQEESGKINGVVEIMNYGEEKKVYALVADIELEDIFGNIITLSNQMFISDNEETNQLKVINVPMNQIPLNVIKKAYLNFKKYIMHGSDDICYVDESENVKNTEMSVKELKSLRVLMGNDAVCESAVSDDYWRCCCGSDNDIKVKECIRCQRKMDSMKGYKNTVDIQAIISLVDGTNTVKVLLELLADKDMPNKDEVLVEIQRIIKFERMYGGNMIEDAKKTVINILTRDM